MKNKKTFTNSKFPNTSIDILFDDVYGGGRVIQFKNNHSSSMTFAKKSLSVFVEELKKEGWQ